jgi:homospermidine synthase
MTAPDAIRFDGTILILGCGSVAQCTLPLLLRHLDTPASRITVMDFVDNRERIADHIAAGVRYVVDRVTKENMGAKLAEHVQSGDILLDLAWNIDCNEILQWCHDNGVRYLNTSVEVWDPYDDATAQDPRDRSLYVRHMRLRKMTASWSQPGPTAVLEHGANPGLVSHMTKESLTSIARRVLAEKPTHLDGSAVNFAAVQAAMDGRDYARLAMHLGVKVIHVAERDTQITNRPKEPNEFVNTWSVDGLYEEGVAPAELGWGTHEVRMPDGAYVHQHGPSNQIALARMGMDTKVRSWSPTGPIHGFVIRHGEAFTISDHLTVWGDGPDRDLAVYRPTVHYAYCMPDVAIASLHELRMRHLVMQDRQRIMNDEIIDGADYMGVLLMGHPFKSWWTGSCLTIHEARALLSGQSATTLQVASSIVGAVRWMIDEPARGVVVPDQLPWDQVLGFAKQYLGTYHDAAADWTPMDNREESNLFRRHNRPVVSSSPADGDPTWQFTTFLVD